MIRKFNFKLLTIFLTSLLASLFCIHDASAKVIRDDHNDLSQQLALPIHQWRDDSVAPKAVVIAIHGLTLHGTLFDSYARNLASLGILVVAPDLRGYGDWFAANKHATISYKDSQHDLGELVTALRAKYKKLPLFCSGESLGGAMTIRLAAANPEWFDGLILSAPALRLSHHVPLKTFLSTLCTLVEPKRGINLSPYLEQCTPDEHASNWNACEDKLVRSRLSVAQLHSSFSFIDSTDRFVSSIPSTMPVLVIQGKEDHVLSMGGMKRLEERLVCTDQTVQMFEHRGHILLERKDVPDDTMHTVTAWLDKHCADAQSKLADGGYHGTDLASSF